MRRLAAFLFVLALLACGTPAFSQSTSAGLTPCGIGITINVTVVSANSQLQSCGPVAVVYNNGTDDVYLALGSASTTAATTSGWILPSGHSITLNVGTNRLYLAAIAPSSTSTIKVVQGLGSPAISGGGGSGGGGGGAITAADGAIVSIGTTTDGACAGDATSGCTELSRLSRIAARLTTIITTGIPVTNANANGQATMANSSPVVIASNQTAADPCMFQAKTNLAISQNGTSSVQLIALSGSTSIYVCSLSLIAAGATTVAITTGTGTACVTGNAAVIGSTTSNIANSMSFAANGGMTMGNGQGTVAKGASSSELCMILGSNVFVSGNLTYVQQ